ncbi:MAG TPA: HD domain-containing protein [Pyrinomonadaceae bacterium]|nr:HD domain-containing protein [Pyrinomonadaceae bacterium]
MIKHQSSNPATIEDAILIAAQAHKGVKDKAGAAYILHPLRMMMRLNSEAEMITAVLHDVVEDTRDNPEESKWTIEKLRAQGFSKEVLEAVECVTNREGEAYEKFIERAGKNPIARRVKIADLEDNMNIQRIGELKPKDLERLEKYHRSWRILTAENRAK